MEFLLVGAYPAHTQKRFRFRFGHQSPFFEAAHTHWRTPPSMFPLPLRLQYGGKQSKPLKCHSLLFERLVGNMSWRSCMALLYNCIGYGWLCFSYFFPCLKVTLRKPTTGAHPCDLQAETLYIYIYGAQPRRTPKDFSQGGLQGGSGKSPHEFIRVHV